MSKIGAVNLGKRRNFVLNNLPIGCTLINECWIWIARIEFATPFWSSQGFRPLLFVNRAFGSQKVLPRIRITENLIVSQRFEIARKEALRSGTVLTTICTSAPCALVHWEIQTKPPSRHYIARNGLWVSAPKLAPPPPALPGRHVLGLSINKTRPPPPLLAAQTSPSHVRAQKA